MGKQGQAIIETERVESLACIECGHVMDVAHLPSFSPIKCPACGAQQTVPARFGNFLLLGPLGSGGMGVIYHAVDRDLGRHVALKVMKRSLGDNPEFVKSFRHEAQAAATLNHRNVVQIYSFGQAAGQPYIAMELVDGGRLDEMISHGPLDEERALEIHIEVTEGLNVASLVGLVHGDIKPANILFGQDGSAKVVDFGLASFVGQQQEQAGQVWGTPYYIAPEKARGKKADFRSDIYSLGATLFHVLTGEPPFEGETPLDVVMARLKQTAPDIRARRPDLHQATADLVARMLAREPAVRYPSYPALLVDMRAALEACHKRRQRAAAIAAADPKKWLRAIPWGIILPSVLIISILAIGARFGWQKYKEHQQKAEIAQIESALRIEQERAFSLKGRADELAQTVLGVADEITSLEEQIASFIGVVPETDSGLRMVYAAIEYAYETANTLDDLYALADHAYKMVKTANSANETAAHIKVLENINKKLADHVNDIFKVRDRAVAGMREVEDEDYRIREAQKEEVWRVEAQKERERQEAILKKRAQDEKLEQERMRIAQTQTELDLLDQARADNAPLILKRQFAEAGQALTKLYKDLTQTESLAYYANLKETYAALDDLKNFVIKSIRDMPYKGGWTDANVTYDITKADEVKGLTTALGVHATTPRSWEQVTLPRVLLIVQYYLRNPKMTEKERGRAWLNLALLCHESGDFERAEKCVELALKQDATLKKDVDRLMPGF